MLRYDAIYALTEKDKDKAREESLRFGGLLGPHFEDPEPKKKNTFSNVKLSQHGFTGVTGSASRQRK